MKTKPISKVRGWFLEKKISAKYWKGVDLYNQLTSWKKVADTIFVNAPHVTTVYCVGKPETYNAFGNGTEAIVFANSLLAEFGNMATLTPEAWSTKIQLIRDSHKVLTFTRDDEAASVTA